MLWERAMPAISYRCQREKIAGMARSYRASQLRISIPKPVE